MAKVIEFYRPKNFEFGVPLRLSQESLLSFVRGKRRQSRRYRLAESSGGACPQRHPTML